MCSKETHGSLHFSTQKVHTIRDMLTSGVNYIATTTKSWTWHSLTALNTIPPTFVRYIRLKLILLLSCLMDHCSITTRGRRSSNTSMNLQSMVTQATLEKMWMIFQTDWWWWTHQCCQTGKGSSGKFTNGMRILIMQLKIQILISFQSGSGIYFYWLSFQHHLREWFSSYFSMKDM